MNIKKSILLRARVAFIMVALFAFAIMFRILHIQIKDGQKWKKISAKNAVQYKTIKATRGNIYSDNGSLLATSLPFYKVAIDPTVIDVEIFDQKIDSLSILLAQYFKGGTAHDYKKRITNARLKNRQYLLLSRKLINYQDKKMMSKWPVFRNGRLKGGAIFQKVDQRFKPFDYLGERTIGYINENNKGAGLEYSFNKLLAGQNGEALFRKMSGGSWKPVFDGNDIKVKHGLDIKTTIDINIQDVAEASLMYHLEQHGADKGCVILMEVKTGEIKAMANLQKLKSGRYAETYNFAVGNQGLTEPGSTIKLASMMALLEEGALSISDSIETGDGVYSFFDNAKPMTDAKDGGYGKLTVREAFEKSSNIGISRLVYDHFMNDPQRFIDYLHQFGLSKPLGFQIIGEGVPRIKTPEDQSWSGISLPWMSIGYELELAPIHTLAFYNAVANDGKLIQPIIVKQALRADRVIENYSSKTIRMKICSDETLKKLRILLEGVVENGTAKNIKHADYKIAGKTGTAQKLKNGKYVKQYYTSFAGYFPAENPKYSCIVVIDNPKGFRRYATDVAAPVFKEIADKIYSLDIQMHEEMEEENNLTPGYFPVIQAGYQPDLQYLLNRLGVSNHGSTDQEWVQAKAVQNSIKWKERKLIEGLVPDVYGMTLRDAIYLLENRGMRVRFEGKGRVKSQSIKAGKKAIDGSVIELKLG